MSDSEKHAGMLFDMAIKGHLDELTCRINSGNSKQISIEAPLQGSFQSLRVFFLFNFEVIQIFFHL